MAKKIVPPKEEKKEAERKDVLAAKEFQHKSASAEFGEKTDSFFAYLTRHKDGNVDICLYRGEGDVMKPNPVPYEVWQQVNEWAAKQLAESK